MPATGGTSQPENPSLLPEVHPTKPVVMPFTLRPLLVCLTVLLAAALSGQAERPNIIFILTDDLGYGDLGRFFQDGRSGDQTFDTPRLDSLAARGMLLTDHYVGGPVCAPSRASFLQGLHQGHAAVRNNQFDKPIPPGLNVAELLRGAGYRTVLVGKYGLAGKRNSDLPAHPLRRGFTDFFGYLHHVEGHEHYPRNGTTEKKAFVTDGYETITEGTDKTYTTDLFTARAKAYLIEQQRERRDQPMFMYLAYDTPHSKLQVPTGPYPAGYGRNGGLVFTGADDPATPFVNTARGTIDSWIHPDYADRDWPDAEKRFATMVRRLDTAIGDLLQLLEDLGIADNTLVVFSSDNGPHNVGGRDPQFFQSYGPYTGIKRDMWEGGVRVPTIATWPARITAGGATAEPVGNWDWLATFADLAGVAVPAYTDGASLLPLLDGSQSRLDREYLYWEYFHPGKTPDYSDFPADNRQRRRGEMQAVRLGNYKGVRFDITSPDAPFEIYALGQDTAEATNLAGQLPELQSQMQQVGHRGRRPDTSAARPYDTVPIPALAPAGNMAAGLWQRPFDTTGHWLPKDPRFSADGKLSTFESFAAAGAEVAGVAWDGYLEVPETGEYQFSLDTDGALNFDLHDIHLLHREGERVPEQIRVTLHLEAGPHPVRIHYVPGAEPNLSLRWKQPGETAFSELKSADFGYPSRTSSPTKPND